jgi:plastocyanin
MTSNRSYRTVAIAFAAALTLVAAVLADRSAPAHAFPATASFTAVDLAWGETGTGSATVHVDPGAVVSFAYPSGANSHNADFGATAPSSCAQTAGADVGAVPPLPALPSGPGWSGTCTFNTTGTYQFHCDLHSSMHGTILVGDVPDPPPATGGSGGGGGGTNTGGGSGGASDPLTDLKIARTQRGTKVKGSIPAVSQGADLSIYITAKS